MGKILRFTGCLLSVWALLALGVTALAMAQSQMSARFLANLPGEGRSAGLDVSSNALDFLRDEGFTYEAWVRPAEDRLSNIAYFTRTTGGDPVSVMLWQGRLTVRLRESSTSHVQHQHPRVLPLGEWSHVAMVYDRSTQTLTLYVNGEAYARGGGPSVLMHATDIVRMMHYSGDLDEIRVWNKTLPEATLEAWRSRSVRVSHPDFDHLQVYLTFDDVVEPFREAISQTAAVGHGVTLADGVLPFAQAPLRFRISGTVESRGGPLAGVAVGGPVPVVTDDAGRFIMNNVGLGTFALAGEMAGYHIVSQTVSFTAGSATTDAADVVLQAHLLSPTVLFPPHALTGVSIEPTLTWAAIPGALGYQVEIARDPAMADLLNVPNAGLTGRDTVLKVMHDAIPLSNSTAYYWRVSAVDALGATGASPVHAFQTTAALVPHLNNPGESAVRSSESLLFSWSYHANAPLARSRLQVKYAEREGWVNLALNVVVNERQFTTSILEPGRSFAWRVISIDDRLLSPDSLNGSTLSYSRMGTFRTSGGAVVPKVSYPTNAATVYTNTPTLNWYITMPQGRLYFDVQLGTDPFLNDVPTHAGLTTRFLALSEGDALIPGLTYQWRVRSCYVHEAQAPVCSSWSPEAHFRTQGAGTPIVPTLSWPAHGVTVYNQPVRLSWHLGTGVSGLSYVVYYAVCATTDCAAELLPTQTPAENFVRVTTLERSLDLVTSPGTAYTWFVHTTSLNGGDSAPSARRMFRTAAPVAVTQPTPWGTGPYPGGGSTCNPGPAIGTPMPVALSTWPVCGADQYTVTPEFRWYLYGSALHAAGYQVCWGTTGDAETDCAPSRIHEINEVATTRFTVPEGEKLDWGADYRWYVRPVGASVWTVSSFKTVGTSGSLRPRLSQPSHRAVVSATGTLLRWYVTGALQAVEHYEVQWSRTPAFLHAPEYTWTERVLAPTQAFVLTELMPGATYYWRVRAWNGVAYSAWADPVWAFTVAPGAGPIVPDVASPIAGVLVPDSSPMLSWGLAAEAENALTYDVEYWGEGQDASPKQVSGIETPFMNVTDLPPGRVYWRVRSRTAEGNLSEYSELASFTSGTITSSDRVDEVAVGLQISALYPNPTRSGVTLAFTLSEPMPVRIRVFEMTGREVLSISDPERPVGRHTVVLAGQEAPGVYLIRVEAGSWAASRTLVVLH